MVKFQGLNVAFLLLLGIISPSLWAAYTTYDLNVGNEEEEYCESSSDTTPTSADPNYQFRAIKDDASDRCDTGAGEYGFYGMGVGHATPDGSVKFEISVPSGTFNINSFSVVNTGNLVTDDTLLTITSTDGNNVDVFELSDVAINDQTTVIPIHPPITNKKKVTISYPETSLLRFGDFVLEKFVTGYAVSDVAVVEGDTGTNSLTFTVTRSGDTSTQTTLDYSTSPGSAAPVSDYEGKSGTLTFPVGITSQTVEITIYPDGEIETDEMFYIDLSNPSSGTVTVPFGVGTITNDDSYAVNLSGLTGKTSEWGDSATFYVALNAIPGAGVSVVVASGNTDEGTVTGGASITFGIGDWYIPQLVTVTGVDDLIEDGDISYQVTATADGGGYMNDSSSIMIINLNNEVPLEPPAPTTTPEPTITVIPEPTGSPEPSPTTNPEPTTTPITPEPSVSPLPTTVPSPQTSPEPSPDPIPEPSITPTPTSSPEPSPSATPVIEPGVFGLLDDTELQNLAATDLAQLDPDQVSTITPEQVAQITPDAISGISSAGISALAPQTVNALTSEQVQNISSETIQQISDADLGQFLTALDPEKVSIADVVNLLPEGWSIDPMTGKIIPPTGTFLALPILQPSSTPGFTPAENIPDLNKNFSLGGQGGESLLDKANQVIQAAGLAQFSFSQDPNTGRIVFDNSEVNQNFSFVPDGTAIKQVEESVPSGVAINSEGFFVLTTDDHRQLTFRPSPVDAAELGSTLNGVVHIGDKGNVLISRSTSALSALFGFEVVQLPASTPTGPLVNPDGSVLYVFESGLAQPVYPVPNSPDILDKLLMQQIAGISDLSFNADGSIKGLYKGRPVIIQTFFEANVRDIPTHSDNSNGSLSFNQIENDGSLVLIYRSPLPVSNGLTSTRRARLSEQDVEQRISIRNDPTASENGAQGNNDKSQCLDSAQKPSNFLGFIQEIASCKFIIY